MAQSALFRRGSIRLFRAVGVGIAAASLMLSGCDSSSNKADKDITQQLDDAADLTATGSDANRVAAHQLLDTASRDTDASIPVRLRAKVMLADSELRTAQDLASQVQRNDAVIDRLVREIDLLSGEIASNNSRAAALQKYEPTNLQNTVTQKQTDIKGSDDKPDWYKTADTSLASLSANDKQATALQSQVSQLQDTIKTEMQQRDQLLDDADKLAQQSYHEQKQKSVDLYVQAADNRKKAADLTVKIDQDNVDLARAQADLAVRQGQHDSLGTALKGFDDKSTFFAQDWTTVQAEIADLNANSKKVYGEDPVTPPARDSKTMDLHTESTIGSKASAIMALAKTNHDLRSVAETHFNSAIGFYKDAEQLAQTLQQELDDKLQKKPDSSQNPDYLPLNGEKETLDKGTIRYQEADAVLQKAEFFARAAGEYKTRLDLFDRLKPVITAAQLSSYPTLEDSDGSIAAALKSAQASAVDGYTSASETLSQLAEGASPAPLRGSAWVQSIYAHYDWSLMEASMGDASKAADQLTLAKNAITSAVGENINLPVLPAELGPTAPTTPGK